MHCQSVATQIIQQSCRIMSSWPGRDCVPIGPAWLEAALLQRLGSPLCSPSPALADLAAGRDGAQANIRNMRFAKRPAH